MLDVLAIFDHPIDDPIFFQLGPLTVRYYGILFATAILVGYLHLRKQFEQCGGDVEDAENLFLTLFLCVVLGARVGHAAFYQPELLRPDRLIRVWEGGLASHGATIALLIGIWIGARRLKTSYFTVSDRLAGGVAFGSSFVRLGNFINQEIVGRTTDVAWAVRFGNYRDPRTGFIDDAPRHPSQLYEFAIGIAIYIVLRLVDRRYGVKERPRGLPTFLFLALYFSCRFLVEYAKEYQVVRLLDTDFPLTMGQLLSIPFALVGWAGVVWVLRRPRPEPTPEPEPEPEPEKTSPPPPAGPKGKKAKKKGKKKGRKRR